MGQPYWELLNGNLRLAYDLPFTVRILAESYGTRYISLWHLALASFLILLEKQHVMKTKFFVALFATGVMGFGSTFAQNVRSTTTTTTTEQTSTDQATQAKPVGDQATMDTKSGKKARKAEKKMAKGKEHKALKKQEKADEKEAVGR